METTHDADVLVIFGITGDLAKVMTFQALYRLEERSLLTCPIVGVAMDRWSVDDLRKRAQESIEATEASWTTTPSTGWRLVCPIWTETSPIRRPTTRWPRP